jgi:phosphatidylglycerol:prolipoprotein diacylglycerol transferase
VHPVLIDFGTIEIGGKTIPLAIGSYGLLFALAIVTGWLWFRHLGRQLDPDASWTDLYFITIISGFVGAKAANLIVFLPEIVSGEKSFLGALSGGGVWLGGVIVGVTALYLQARRLEVSFGLVANVLFVAIPFGHAVGRIGCLLGGCCHGSSCSLPWAIVYTNPLANRLNGTPLNVPLHPTVVYEAILEMVNFAICYSLFRRKAGAWTVVATWAGLYGVQRFFLEFLRNDPRGGYGFLSTSQWISLAMAGASISWALFLRANRRGRASA